MFKEVVGCRAARDGDADALAEPRIGHGETGDPLHLAMAQCQRLDVGGIDVVAAANDEVLEAALDFEVAVLVYAAKITRHEPAIAIEAHGRGVLLVEIAKHERRAPPTDLTHSTGADRVVPVGGVEKRDL